MVLAFFFRFLFSLMILFSSNSLAQSSSEKWLPVAPTPTKLLYLDVEGLENFTGDDFYIWVMENHSDPVEMEGVRDDIYKSKTYYLFSKKLKKYSILEVIYYDRKGNILKYYNYNRDTELDSYKYNYPVLQGSNEEIILERCVNYINNN